MKNVAKTYEAMKDIMENDNHKEIQNLKNIFSEELNSKRTITLHMVKARFGELQNSGLTVVQVRDKLRYIKKKLNRESQEVLEKVESTETIEPETNMNAKSDHSSDMGTDEPSSELFDSEESTLNRFNRTVYSSKNGKLIQKYFSNYITDSAVLIREQDVVRILNRYQELQEIKSKYPIKSLIIKIRTKKRKYMNL